MRSFTGLIFALALVVGSAFSPSRISQSMISSANYFSSPNYFPSWIDRWGVVSSAAAPKSWLQDVALDDDVVKKLNTLKVILIFQTACVPLN